MALGDLYIQVRGIQGGENCYTNLKYMSEDLIALSDVDELVVEFVTTVIGSWMSFVSDSFEFLSAKGTLYIPSASLPREHTEIIAASGAVAGDVMPPNVTARLIKVPDNATIEPPTAEEFEQGRVSFSGIPEAAQSNGLLTATAMSNLTSIANDLLEWSVNPGTGIQTWRMGMWRNTPTPGNEHVYLADLYPAQFLGTQNTRKRR